MYEVFLNLTLIVGSLQIFIQLFTNTVNEPLKHQSRLQQTTNFAISFLIFKKTTQGMIFIPPANFVVGILFSLCPCVCPCVRPSVTLCFLNIFKSHCWIFIKSFKQVHICKVNTLNKKVRARGQFY